MTWNRWDESSSAQLATVWVEVVRDGGVGELYCPVQLIFGRRSEWSAVIHEISSIRAAAAQSSPFYAGSPLTSPSSSLWTSECTSIIHSLINGLQLNYQLTAVGCGIWSHPKDLISYMWSLYSHCYAVSWCKVSICSLVSYSTLILFWSRLPGPPISCFLFLNVISNQSTCIMNDLILCWLFKKAIFYQDFCWNKRRPCCMFCQQTSFVVFCLSRLRTGGTEAKYWGWKQIRWKINCQLVLFRGSVH